MGLLGLVFLVGLVALLGLVALVGLVALWSQCFLNLRWYHFMWHYVISGYLDKLHK